MAISNRQLAGKGKSQSPLNSRHVLHPKSETVKECTLSRKGAASGKRKRGQKERARVLASGGGADERRRERQWVSGRVGSRHTRSLPLAGTVAAQREGSAGAAGGRAGEREPTAEASAGREGTGGGFFARCLAQ